MITTGAANAVLNLVSISLMTVPRKRRAGLFLKKRQKRYERWRPDFHLESGDRRIGPQYHGVTLGHYEKERSLMIRSPTIDEIQNLGFEWPKYTLIEQNCVMDGLRVDLFRTIGKLMKALAELEDLSFKATEVNRYRSNEIAVEAFHHEDAIRYLRSIQAAFEKRELGLTDYLVPAWPMLGITRASEVRALTIAEVDQWLESSAVRCVWTDWTSMQLRWLSRKEVEEIRSALLEPSDGFPPYGYMASEWCTDEGETFLLFRLYYWPI